MLSPSRAGRRVLCVLFEHDYGRPELGPSVDRRWFLDGFTQAGAIADPFWWDRWVAGGAGLREALLARIDADRPDLVFMVPHRDQFSPDLLDELKARVPTMAWFGDDHWRFAGYSSRLAPHFTHVVTTDPWSVTGYRTLGVEPIVSDWASEPCPDAQDPPETDADYEHDVTFIGARNEVRSWCVGRLGAAGIRVECFGAGWPAGRIPRNDMQRIFRSSRINLNLSNSVPADFGFPFSGPRSFLRWLISAKRSEQVKARNFEIPMAGGFQLTRYALGLERHFLIGEEVAVFTSVDECARQIRRYLAEPELRISTARLAQERARREHTYGHRLAGILARIWP